MRCTVAILGCLAGLWALPPTGAAEPENDRLSGETFRRGLKQLGLSDLLEYYIQQHPPKDPVQGAMLHRELRLNRYADPTVSSAQWLAAVDEATEILRDLIRRFPDHEDCNQWRLQLGRDLVFLKAEPYFNNILFREGTVEDRAALAEITTEALRVFDRLIEELQTAVKAIDGLSIKQFERLARSGGIEKIEMLLPKARYFRMWASYYYCLTLQPHDLVCRSRLHEIIDYLTRDSMLVHTDHSITRHQAQALLLAGMAYRLLELPDRAEEFLSQAAEVTAAIPNYAERHNLKWVITLANLERVKNFRETRQYDRAAHTLQQFRGRLPTDARGQFSLFFTLALLEGSIYRQQALSLPADQAQRREALLLRSRQPLIALARQHPRHQSEIYATLFDQLGEVDDPTTLDSFEQNLFIAAMLRRVNQLNGQLRSAGQTGSSAELADLQDARRAALQQATRVAEKLLEDESALSQEIRPEVRFNLAVCRNEQGDVLEAIQEFNLLVAGNPDFSKSRSAAEFAVRLTESAFAADGLISRPDARALYLEALGGLIAHFPGSPLARDRRYAYARTLQQDGRLEEAIQYYADLPEDDLHQLEARSGIAECHLQQLRQAVGQADADTAEALADTVLQSAESVRQQLTGTPAPEINPYFAESLLIAAEADILRPRKRSQRAIQTLTDFEDRFAQHPDLLGRAMRIRIIAYQDIGRWEQAAAIIPDYIRRDPANAGATLQGLLSTFHQEIQAADRSGRLQDAQRLAQDALLVARSLVNWVRSDASRLSTQARFLLQLECGEAMLRAGRPTEALAVFRETIQQDEAPSNQQGRANSRALYGLAEAYYQSGRYEQALTRFNRLYQQSPENSPWWWKSFLREIQCRQALEQDAQTLYKLIKQKEVFFPSMGGLKEEFAGLLRELSPKS